jgi:hypothetical protein
MIIKQDDEKIYQSNFISSLFPGNNFVTPDTVELGKISNKYAYEISKGYFPFYAKNLIYGVTIASLETKKVVHDLGMSFELESEAREYLIKLDKESENV